MKAHEYNISSEKFVFRTNAENLHDAALETKPVSYFKDAMNRFAKNKASIVAAIIILIIMLFSLFGSIITPYTVEYYDTNYKFARPKSQAFYNLSMNSNIHIWDGGAEKDVNKATYEIYRAIEQEMGRKVIMTEPKYTKEEYFGKTTEKYKFRLDTYNAVGAVFIDTLTTADYEAIQKYQDENNVQIILPITDPAKRPTAEQDLKNANIWFLTQDGKSEIVYKNNDGETFIPIYMANDGTDHYTSKVLWEGGEEKQYNYAVKMQGDQWQVRVDYYEYYKYKHAVAGDGITEPCFLFGADNNGKDMFTCLASGARFSILLAIVVASVNLFVGAIYGAIEGYYGGRIDLLMERFVDLIGSIPFMIVITLLKYHFNVSHLIILFISFFLTGWTGMAARTRMQFYRFKHQEYVLVARTLGAKDRRIMFKHIFPNAIGTLITGSVLVIPSVIFSETSLSYLNIINLDSGKLTSVGTLLSKGQTYLFTYPHIIIPPAIFISLLMLSFNLFGNGLRDAFNPSLRGTE